MFHETAYAEDQIFFSPYLPLLSILLSTANLLLKRFFVTSFLKDLLKSKNRKKNLAAISYFLFNWDLHVFR